ncbi:MAG: acetyl-CoA acetyltransferase [Acidimicrobiia bacterium]|nr:acetyl-CoA acetyltransferase [Acidimicrobiia bacterium]
MTVDARTPVVVGVAQAIQRPDDPAEAVEAIALMERVVRRAAADAGAPDLLSRLDHVGVVQGAWRYSDPGRLLADAVGSPGARTSLSANGGNTPQSYVNALATRIQAGEIDRAVIVGGETIWSRRRQRRAGLEVRATTQQGVEPDERFQSDVPMTTDFELSRGMEQPVNYYPLFDSAIRASRGETIDEHRDRIAALWARFNEVAVANDYAWFRTPMTPEEIRDPSPSNRMVGFPYTKAMNSNWDLDQAAALVLCSAEAATEAGIPKDRWVFPWAGTDAHDTYAVSERRDLHSSPAIAEAGKRLYSLGGVDPHDIAHVDLYSCFPSAVQVAAESLELGEHRQLTQTGGLTFAGGPLNNYVTHSIATMVDVLRDDEGAVGLVSANGGYLTKHALGLYSTEPPASAFRAEDVQDLVDEVPRTGVAESHTGQVTVEAYTVMHDRNGPEVGLCALRTGDGRRTWGKVTDTDVAARMTEDEAIGQPGELDIDGVLHLA